MAQAQSSVQAPSMTEDYLDEEVDATSLRNLSDLLIAEWQKLGDKLGIKPAKIHNIKQDNLGNEGEMKYKMLLFWQQKNGRNATYRCLFEGLKKVDRDDLVDNIDEWKNSKDLR